MQNTAAHLIYAELAYARFNACRTTEGCETQIIRGRSHAFEYLCDASRPGNSYYNRAVCLDASSINAAELALLPSTVRAIEVPPASSNNDAATHLLKFGLRPAYALCYLEFEVSSNQANAVQRARGSTSVTLMRGDQADEFLDLLQLEGANFTEEKRAQKRRFYCTHEFVAFVAKDETGVACAWATLHLCNGTAFLGNTFTREQYRRNGHHLSLLAIRLQYANSVGVSRIYIDVEYGSQSQRNCERVGMRNITINTIWVKTS
jgi:hypothetical protein